MTSAIYQNVWSQGNYIYHTVSSGINVYNDSTSTLLYNIYTPDEPSAVWANDNYIYISTVNSGVYRATISGAALPYYFEPDLTSDNTIYLHGNGNYLCVSTVSGVDRFNLSTDARIYTSDQYIHKCFQTISGTLYYIENTRFYNVSEIDLGDALRNWNYYQYITFTPTNIDNAQVYINIPNTFSFNVCKPNGQDLRFISNDDEVLSYYVESWYPNARVVVKAPTAGTTGFYMLYGNSQAPDQSDGSAAYLLFDDFNGTSLNTDIWNEVINGDGVITIQDGYVQFKDYDNDIVGISSKEKIPYGFTEIKFRIYPINTGRTYFQIGYSTINTNLDSRGHVYLDGSYYHNYHRLYPYYEAMVQGTEIHSLSWRNLEFLMTEGLQSSDYSGELLTNSGTGLPTTAEYYYIIRQSGRNNDGYIQLDYIKVTSYPINETTTSTEYSLWDINKPKLHVAYNPSSNWASPDYTYETFYATPGLLNDVHVTSGTIFLGTDRGAYVIEELQGNEENARKKYFFID